MKSALWFILYFSIHGTFKRKAFLCWQRSWAPKEAWPCSSLESIIDEELNKLYASLQLGFQSQHLLPKKSSREVTVNNQSMHASLKALSTMQSEEQDQSWTCTCCFCCTKQLWSMRLAATQHQQTLYLERIKIKLSAGQSVQLVSFLVRLFEQELICRLRCWVCLGSIPLQSWQSPYFSFCLDVDKDTEDKSELVTGFVTCYFHTLIILEFN